MNGLEVAYYHFCDQDEKHWLSVEFWGSDVEVSRGFVANDYDFNIIAGS